MILGMVLGGCERHYNVPSEVSTTGQGELGLGIITKTKKMDPELLKVTTFEVDQCTYIAVMKSGYSESLQVVHSSSCPNHAYTSNGGLRPLSNE